LAKPEEIQHIPGVESAFFTAGQYSDLAAKEIEKSVCSFPTVGSAVHGRRPAGEEPASWILPTPEAE